MNILDSIRECEAKAAELRAEAAGAARDAARDGERETERMAKEIVEAALAKAAGDLEAARAASENKAGEFIASSAAVDGELVKAAGERLGETADFICQGVLSA